MTPCRRREIGMRYDQHRRRNPQMIPENPIPTIQCDFVFLKMYDHEENLTCLSAIDRVYERSLGQKNKSGDASHPDVFPGCSGCEGISGVARLKECDNYYGMNHSGALAPIEKIPRVSTVIMSIEGEERCTVHEEFEPIGDLFWCVKIGMEREIWKMSDLGLGVGQ
eukprot:5651225-Amphidinium_carterae.1